MAFLFSSILCAFVISAIWTQIGSCQPGEQLEDTATDSVHSSKTLPMVPVALYLLYHSTSSYDSFFAYSLSCTHVNARGEKKSISARKMRLFFVTFFLFLISNI